MKNIETQLIIHASKEKVWAVLSDFENYKNWNPFIRDSKGIMKKGTKLVNTIYIGDKKNVFNPTLVEVIPNESFSWLGSLYFKQFFSGRHYFKLEELDQNKVRLIHGEDFLGIMSTIFYNMIHENTRAGFKQMNLALKKECEQ